MPAPPGGVDPLSALGLPFLPGSAELLHLQGTSSELERLMEDSADSEVISTVAASPGPAVSAATRSPERESALSPSSPPLPAPEAQEAASPDPIRGKELPPAPAATSAAASAGAAAVVSQPSPPQATLREPPPAMPPPRAEESWAMQSLCSRLEDVTRQLRRAVEQEFVVAERTIQAQHRAEMEAQRSKAQAVAVQQEARLETLESEKQQLGKRLELKQKQLNRSFLLVQKTRKSVTGRFALEGTLRAWRAAAAAGKDERLQTLLADKVHFLRLSQSVFGFWRSLSQTASREAHIAHERAVAEMVRCKLFESNEQERARLAAEVESLKKQLAEEAQQRALLQDNLKRVFMRGVCALNFEAMSLLSEPSSASALGELANTGLNLTGPAASGAFDWSQLSQSVSAHAGPASSAPSTGLFGAHSTVAEAGSGVSSGLLGESSSQPTMLPSSTLPLQPPAAEAVEVRIPPPVTVTTQPAPAPAAPAESPAAPAASPPQASAGRKELTRQEGPRQAPCPLPFLRYTGPPPEVISAASGRPAAKSQKGPGGGAAGSSLRQSHQAPRSGLVAAG